MATKILNYTGWTIVLITSMYFLYANALHYFFYNSESFGYLWSFAPFVLIHIIGGMIALLCGPFQFISSLRNKHPRVHRMIGKTYLGAVLTSALASFYLSVDHDIVQANLVTFGTGLIGLATAWLLTGGMAYWSARNKNFVQHREWMIRSYVVTCGFTTFRLFTNVMEYRWNIPANTAGDIMAWACWAFPLLITEALLQGNKIQRGARAMSRKKNPVTRVTITTPSADSPSTKSNGPGFA